MGWLTMWRTRRQSWRSQPHMLFTLPGVLLMMVTVGLSLDTFNEPSPIKRVVVSFLFGVLIVDVAWLIRQTRRIRLVEAWAERTRAQEGARIVVSLNNDSASDALMRVALDSRGQPSSWTWVLRQQKSTVEVTSGQVLDRGEHTFPDLLCELHSPLRLFYARWVSRPNEGEEFREALVVWPAPWVGSLPPFPMAQEPAHAADHQVLSKTGGEGEGRAQSAPGAHGWLREWRRGDRLAHIAHKASAHRDQMLVQTACDQEQKDQPNVTLSLAWALGLTEGKVEPALSLLGTLAEHALRQGRRVGLTLDHTSVVMGHGEHQRQRVLDALARIVRTP